MRILLQTTNPGVQDDWHAGRFSMLAEQLAATRSTRGSVEVTARDLQRDGTSPDPVLMSLASGAFDQLWLLAVDAGGGLNEAECRAINAFRRRGGGVLAARDHQDLGCSLAGLSGIGPAHQFHTINPDAALDRRCVDDQDTTAIDWPNYHSGRNGEVQPVEVVSAGHPLMISRRGGSLRFLPAHPHEGSVCDTGPEHAQIVARGRSAVSKRTFNLIAASEGEGSGRWIAESSFHHFADYNWDPRRGAPSFVSEVPGDDLFKHPEKLDDVRDYISNAVRWLGREA